MYMHRFAALAIAVCLAAAVFVTPASAQEHPFTMQPASGPANGGTVVTITGPFSTWPYSVIFRDADVPAYRTDSRTIVVITPPGTGTVPVYIIEGDMGIAELEFTYLPVDSNGFERLLLPILTPPASGAHGSEFRTELRAYNRSVFQHVRIEGIGPEECPGICGELPVIIGPGEELQPEEVTYSGTPGRFIYVPRFSVDELWTSLRVFDTSRSADNYGTTIPVVRERDMFIDRAIVFAGLPSEPRFRNTLRIYGTTRGTVNVEIAHGTSAVTRQVTLEGAERNVSPAYAVIGDLPSGVGPLRITIRPPAPGTQLFGTPLWAFVSVTNNETQMITVVTP
jgi:IPT/TIG domain